jgi:inositol-phosphate phosphatase/L-galactose 1-phosphate phosphatase/histidinol-phosphatase
LIRPARKRAPEACPQRFISLAEKLADAAGVVARRYFRTNVRVIGKKDASPVTIADRKAEKAMRAIIARAFPDHGILGEEYGAQRIDAEYVWVLDPVDGTKAFIAGIPLFGTLVALTRRGKPILGVIDQPITRERWVGAVGRKTVFCGRVAKTRRCAKIADATLIATSPQMFRPDEFRAFERLRKKVKLPRYGGDCYGYGLVASGHIDIVVEAGLKPYDFLAQAPILAGAGGIITDWKGRALTLGSGRRVCACGDRKLHKRVLRVLAG